MQWPSRASATATPRRPFETCSKIAITEAGSSAITPCRDAAARVQLLFEPCDLLLEPAALFADGRLLAGGGRFGSPDLLGDVVGFDHPLK